MLMLITAVLAAGIFGTFTDWLFMGVLFHSAYNKYPEVWWPAIREGKETGAIVWAAALCLIMSAGVVALCALVGVSGIVGGIGVAAIVWAAGPLVVLVVNGFFVKIDPKVTFAHSLGYLVRMAIAGAAAGIALPLA